ncbi:hypothetical protein [Sphingobacterium sp. DR205]|uniref:hypothetical protein n=1 Tax=Sphingobacterium sp. DR205 TaxID=2713573 RepID=UPI0013E51CB7|nr:hypothetical protein [Sphingobacterium sp. DR205]QIH36754.1 hypothetical protein G6053_29595 [Sphingobacterium sp. DR205]
MKRFIIVFVLLYNMNIYGQVQDFKDIPKDILGKFDSMETHGSLFLNPNESAYFNVLIENSRRDFDFTNKKIAFFRGATGQP